MKENDINNEFPDDKKPLFFDTEAVETAKPVVPLTDIETENTGDRFRVPVRKRRFSPAFLSLILLLSSGVLAGIVTLAYHSALWLTSETEPVNTVTAVQAEQMQAEAENPASEPVKINVPPQKKVSRNKNSFRDSQNNDFEQFEDEFYEDDAWRKRENRRQRRMEDKRREKFERKMKRVEREAHDIEGIFDEDNY